RTRCARVEALQRLAALRQDGLLLVQLGAQRRKRAALALARRSRLGPRPVLLHTARVEDRDLARHADEVGRAERAARPGAPERKARHGIALAVRLLDARLRRLAFRV